MSATQERRMSHRIDCYSRSKIDDDVEHGLVIDISETGACLLIPKDTPLFKGSTPEQLMNSGECFRLYVIHPDYSLEDGLDVNANIVWLNPDSSESRIKVGVLFPDMDGDKTAYVAKFIDWIQKKENYFLHCELEKC